ncbi:carbohydrate ABC transporter permease [Lipingzhangella sp. LS1_29]|uniref:Carbohydrate ABC transporter permease n=1 Tax=Lipingzhangella rawalii TaxID=2055835 RepID=A0ABU2H3U7_9ACTN|nr:carbohydrate ABC transporter permease [Lipingzhangella rawalii]MDS1269672.1 carbohydrate ABC transporter permease [Lipingzhangella rawalii]
MPEHRTPHQHSTTRGRSPHRIPGRPFGRVTTGSLVLYLVAISAAVFWLAPLLWALSTATKPEGETNAIPARWIPTDPTLEHVAQVLGRGEVLRWILNSVVVSSLVTLLTLVLCCLAAYGFSRCVFPGRAWVFALVIGGILIPPQAVIVPQFILMTQLNMVDTYWGIALPQVVTPIFVFILKRFFDGIPRDYEDAARMDGAGHLRVLFSVILPLSRPILAAVGIFVFIGAWNNFLWPFVVVQDPDLMTIPVGLGTVASDYGLQYAPSMAAAVIGALPLLIVFLLFQRQIVTGIAGAGIKG